MCRPNRFAQPENVEKLYRDATSMGRPLDAAVLNAGTGRGESLSTAIERLI
jgi:hypothetical protein